MDSVHKLPKNRWQLDLRYKVALLFAAPVLLMAVLILVDHFTAERKALEEQARISSVQMGSLILASLKHTMIDNDHSMMEKILAGTSQHGNITRIWIVDLNGVVALSSILSEAHFQTYKGSIGCVECHQFPPESRPQVQRIRSDSSTVRVAIPIDNDPECTGCHSTSQKHLGVLLTDISLADVESFLDAHLNRNILLVLGLTALAVLSAFFMVNILVIRRIEVMQKAMQAFEKGDYSVRISKNWWTDDEITRLADAFNVMVEAIARHADEQQKLTDLRQQAIQDERERIGRELHDGIAQFLAYVNTKVVAISTLLSKNELQAAQIQIDQILDAVHEQSNDVRASILGLRLSGPSGENLAASLREYIRQSNLLLDFPVKLVVEDRAEQYRPDPEIELHLIRIAQEAISNIRKHAHARHAQIDLGVEGEFLVLSVRDDGVGFNPWQMQTSSQPHFGLQNMRERAILAGAEFSLVSEPGSGTIIIVKLRMENT